MQTNYAIFPRKVELKLEWDMPTFKVGDKVKKVSGDSEFVGVIIALGHKLDGSLRIFAESTSLGTRGWVLVFTEKQLNKKI